MIIAKFNSVTEFSDELAAAVEKDPYAVRGGIVRVTKSYRQRTMESVHMGFWLTVVATAVVHANDGHGDFNTLVMLQAPIGEAYQDGALKRVTETSEQRADTHIKTIERDCKTFGLEMRAGVYESAREDSNA